MSAIPRKTQKIFGGSLAANLNVAQFGSLRAGTPNYTLDLDVIQGLAAWGNAWNGAVVTVGGNPNVPPIQDMNAAFLVITQQLAYLLQSGAPEYDSATTYFTGQVVRKTGTQTLYTSLVDTNLGNALADKTKWAQQQSGSYPAGVANVTQTVNVDASGHIVEFTTETFDPDACFDPVLYQYTAPAAGIYQVSAMVQVDNNTAAAATLEQALRVVKNSATILLVGGNSVANPPGSRWYPSVTGLVQLARGDTLEIQWTGNDTVNTGNVDLSNGNFSINRVSGL